MEIEYLNQKENYKVIENNMNKHYNNTKHSFKNSRKKEENMFKL